MSNLAQIYSSTVGPGSLSAPKIEDNKLTYVCITQDRLENNKRNMPVVLPHVDRAVIIDGGSQDGTVEYLKSLGSKVEVYHRAWDDSFANQYNEYLKHIKGGWVLLCDDDELPSEELLSVLREIIAQSEEGTKFGVAELRANDVSYREGDWVNRTDNGPCEYYRQMFFKWYPDMHYSVDLHQALLGMRGPVVKIKQHYYHIKSTLDEQKNACRNYFIAGEWPSGPRSDGIRTPEWQELKQLLAQHHPEVKVFNHLNALLVSKTVHSDIIDWGFKYKTHGIDLEPQTSGELRAYSLYFESLGYKE